MFGKLRPTRESSNPAAGFRHRRHGSDAGDGPRLPFGLAPATGSVIDRTSFRAAGGRRSQGAHDARLPISHPVEEPGSIPSL